jgi:2-keto-3-deoxy-L-rhamnonate aldolase RhmA
VQNAEQARHAGASVRFPPDGIRGTCTLSRSSFYSARRSEFLEHTRQANREILLIGLIEDQEGIDNIDEIVRAEPGPEVYLVGRGDLGTALGTPGQPDSPAVTAATDAIFKALDGVPNRHVAMGVYGPAEVAPWYARGCRFFFYSSDTAILYNAVRGLTDAFHETVAAAAAPDKAKRSAG